MIIKNKTFDINNIKNDNIFICAIGYETRSFYLYNKVENIIKDSNKLVICYKDYNITEENKAKISNINDNASITLRIFEYHDTENAIDCILEFVKKRLLGKETVVHIDYTAMPRSWFCRLALKLRNNQQYSSFFWYTEGKYPDDYKQYPGAGIDQFMLFSGKPSLRINKRFHMFGLSYDCLRTQAMISILDPESYIVCYASNSKNEIIKKNLRTINDQIISQSRISVSLHVEDFESMIYKLRETVLDFAAIGDVVLVPDGPKPLIMAMSLIPDIVCVHGISCLHVSRNKKYYSPIDVTAIDSIIGFTLS